MSHSEPTRRNRRFYRRYGKRALDVTLVVLSLPLTLPVLMLLAATVHCTLGSPVLFRQVRPGLNARPFTLCKFRTMTNARDRTGRLLSDGERLTAFGHWLRAASLDELPELWNVLTGRMSLVGPRPLLMEYLSRYTPEQARRHTVRPGLTGWAQVHGRNTLSWDDRFVRDLDYAANLSFALDLKILYLTVARVVRRDGISAAGEATMPLFMGSSTESPAPHKRVSTV